MQIWTHPITFLHERETSWQGHGGIWSWLHTWTEEEMGETIRTLSRSGQFPLSSSPPCVTCTHPIHLHQSTSITISCCVSFPLFSSFSYNLIKFGALENQKNQTLLPFMPLHLQPYKQQLIDIRALLPSGSEWRNYKMAAWIRFITTTPPLSPPHHPPLSSPNNLPSYPLFAPISFAFPSLCLPDLLSAWFLSL